MPARAGFGAGSAGRRDQVVDRRYRGYRQRDQLLTPLGQPGPGTVTDEEVCAELLFQISDLFGESGLTQRESARR